MVKNIYTGTNRSQCKMNWTKFPGRNIFLVLHDFKLNILLFSYTCLHLFSFCRFKDITCEFSNISLQPRAVRLWYQRSRHGSSGHRRQFPDERRRALRHWLAGIRSRAAPGRRASQQGIWHVPEIRGRHRVQRTGALNTLQ